MEKVYHQGSPKEANHEPFNQTPPNVLLNVDRHIVEDLTQIYGLRPQYEEADGSLKISGIPNDKRKAMMHLVSYLLFSRVTSTDELQQELLQHSLSLNKVEESRNALQRRCQTLEAERDNAYRARNAAIQTRTSAMRELQAMQEDLQQPSGNSASHVRPRPYPPRSRRPGQRPRPAFQTR